MTITRVILFVLNHLQLCDNFNLFIFAYILVVAFHFPSLLFIDIVLFFFLFLFLFYCVIQFICCFSSTFLMPLRPFINFIVVFHFHYFICKMWKLSPFISSTFFHHSFSWKISQRSDSSPWRSFRFTRKAVKREVKMEDSLLGFFS